MQRQLGMFVLCLQLLLWAQCCWGGAAGNAAWQAGLAQTHVRHQKTADQCYHLERRSKTVITTLLPDGPLSGKSGAFLSTFKNLIANNSADVVFFNPHGWPEDRIQDLRDKLGEPRLQVLCIAQHDWAPPQHRDRHWEYVMRDANGPGYRSMCFWNSRRMLQVLYRMGFEWVIRIDTDSTFPGVVPNLVQAMEGGKAVYGFRAVIQETNMFTTALPEAARYWLTAEKLTPTFLLQHCQPPTLEGLSSTGWNHTVIFNNFLITRLSWWMQPHILAWLIHLERLRGSFKHRWGDAPVHTITLGMFLVEQQMLEFGFHYEHDVGADKHTYLPGAFATSWPHF